MSDNAPMATAKPVVVKEEMDKDNVNKQAILKQIAELQSKLDPALTSQTSSIKKDPSEETQQNAALEQKTLLPRFGSASPVPLDLPDGIRPAQFTDKSERAKMWSKYVRSLEVGASKPDVQEVRSKRASKAPQHIIDQCVGLHEKQYYFHVWLNNQSDWAAVEVWEQRCGSKKSQAWLTDDQMMDVFKNRSVVDALQQKCKDDHTEHKPLHRRHPNVPHCAEAHQFLTDIEDSLVETCEKVLKKGATITMQADGAAGEALVRETIAKSASAFGGPSMAQSASSTAGDSDTSMSAEENAKRQRLQRFEELEAEKEKKRFEKEQERETKILLRKEEREREKEKRREYASTPEGRAKVWLAGLQEHISKCDAEAAHCDDKAKCDLPEGLRVQYKSQWQMKSKNMKSARTKIENILNGDATVPDFKKTVDAAEKDIKAFKQDLARYRTLERGYSKAKVKDAQEAAASDSG